MLPDNEQNDFHLDDSRRCYLIETIIALMKAKHLNETQLAKGCNLHQPTIHRLLSGETTDPRLSTLLQIADYFDISLNELIGKKASSEKGTSIKRIPIISWKEAIHGNDFVSALNLNNWKNWSATEIDLSEHAYALYSKSSMEPRFPKNSLLLIEPNLSVTDGDLVIIKFQEADEVGIREIITDGPKKELKTLMGNTNEKVGGQKE
ncbi:MAG: helix-turn-helix domain-containing protein [Gammaproteobacteria bacterium]